MQEWQDPYSNVSKATIHKHAEISAPAHIHQCKNKIGGLKCNSSLEWELSHLK